MGRTPPLSHTHKEAQCTTVMSTNTGSSPFADVPSPWECHGEAIWFCSYISPKKGEYPPPAAFGDTEQSSQFSDAKATGDYHGGLTSLMLIRYKDTPVGVYPHSDFQVLSTSIRIHPVRSL